MRTSLLVALCILAAFALLPSTGSGAAEPPPGQVTFLSGQALRRVAGAAESLALGSPVRVGDVVETAGRTRLEITLRDQSVLRVGPRSKVTLDGALFGRSVEERKVAARLLVGDLWAKVAKAVGGESRFEVQTANAVAGVRGTTFRVNAKTDRSVVVKVYGGTVAVAGGAVPRPAHGGEGAGEGPQQAGEGSKSAASKSGRVQVPGPQEVSRDRWERIVGAMMQVRVSADGSASDPQSFALGEPGSDGFEAWNRERDEAAPAPAPAPTR